MAGHAQPQRDRGASYRRRAVIPIVTPDEMAAIDAAATESVDTLIERAGGAVARHALSLLGGGYGRSVAVVAGRGNNGNDGRVAARRLRARGARVIEIDASSAPERLPAVDLVIDAAYGTGLKRPYDAPALAGAALVLAVDVPSGVDGATGEVLGTPLAADLTVTFAALKPGLLFQPARSLCGEIDRCRRDRCRCRSRRQLLGERHDSASSATGDTNRSMAFNMPSRSSRNVGSVSVT